ncbi:MAG TPA: ABC transporter ATP-binding protein [Hyphomicrobiaceae bacterium]|nr:ABC transporter ATP-binding protein [Hyphomicrobiaceae bacterium]
MLKIDRLSSRYGRIQALREVSLEVREGEIVALVGGNGAGKTTLLKAISGVQPVSGGVILFKGADITRARPHVRVAAGIAQSPEGRQIFGDLSVADNLRLGAYLRRDHACIAEDTERMFAMFPALKELREGPGGALSGGQQQMLAIARALMARPVLLLLDEPSMGLAPVLVDQILAAIAALKAAGTTVFLVEQNAFAALSIADRGYVLETGSVVLQGSGRELLTNPEVQSAYLGV